MGKNKPAGHELSGKISDRIRSGDIAPSTLHPTRTQPAPSSEAVRGAEGHGLGDGANRTGPGAR